MADKGSDALSLKAATRLAKLSRGVAYQHFRDRDHLLTEAKLWISERLANVVKRLDARPTAEHTRNTARLVLNNREAAKLLITDALAGKDFKHNHPLYKLVKKTLKEFVVSGKARKDIDLEVLVYILLGSNATVLMLGESHKRADSNALADRFAAEWTRILERGIFSKVPR